MGCEETLPQHRGPPLSTLGHKANGQPDSGRAAGTGDAGWTAGLQDWEVLGEGEARWWGRGWRNTNGG